ncbi:hypothetical protein [Aurantiacibacter sp. MUD61]|uniref:hypothetical protein n=1 Tax=Aurantiacibacter sp. MUD61 TaxID=3009083 RepID=UPI0022F0E15B|nr:hypothetical protein [Aurantiacibacter sp. MUD61]
MIKHTFLALAALALAPAVHAQDEDPSAAQTQFARIASWEGRWNVAETDALEIVFESTARGSTIIERWETDAGLHSITIYHLDGNRIIATHYCPQGNQPRLASLPGDSDQIAFAFTDITGFDEGESHTHSLGFAAQQDGSLIRTEVYTGAEGLGSPSSYTLVRAPS